MRTWQAVVGVLVLTLIGSWVGFSAGYALTEVRLPLNSNGDESAIILRRTGDTLSAYRREERVRAGMGTASLGAGGGLVLGLILVRSGGRTNGKG